MGTLNQIGLDSAKAQKLADKLNDLLANYQIFYQNMRGFHWNIKGESFFTLHVKFEELYTQYIEDIDLIAERILTLVFTPSHAYTDYLKRSKIKELTDITDANVTVRDTIENLTILIVKEREILKAADDAQDEGTNNMISDFIQSQEKTIWMLSSWLNR